MTIEEDKEFLLMQRNERIPGHRGRIGEKHCVWHRSRKSQWKNINCYVRKKAKSDTLKQQLLAKVGIDEAFSSSAEESWDSKDATDGFVHKANNPLIRKRPRIVMNKTLSSASDCTAIIDRNAISVIT